MLMGFIMDKSGLGGEATASSGGAALSASVSGIAPAWSSSQDTLSPEDRETAWGGPGT